jgi:DICT domain-containing protein
MRDLGLMAHPASVAPVEDLSETAQKLVDHLTMHPLDNEAREKLALIYADHYQRLDLAADQLEQLIATPNQPGKEIARWLNLLADLQIKHGLDIEAVQNTLQRILDLFPGLAAAQLAQQRLEYLPLEFKGKQQSQAVKMGTYEKDLGLKTRSPGSA